MSHCAYCMREHGRKGAYCSAWCGKRGGGHSAAAANARTRALRRARETAIERNRIHLLYRQLAFTDDLGPVLAAIYDPGRRKRARKLGLLSEPK